ncbi:hypothetical protein ACMZ8B_00580 [Gardnerella greenwoodii]|uniref:hypothetical protein n=1 Tax=Gardnerella greenwoodii TaxID=2914925 RepID=UPI0039F00949
MFADQQESALAKQYRKATLAASAEHYCKATKPLFAEALVQSLMNVQDLISAKSRKILPREYKLFD